MQEGTVTGEPEPRAPKSQVADSEAAENHDSLPGWHGKVELGCPQNWPPLLGLPSFLL